MIIMPSTNVRRRDLNGLLIRKNTSDRRVALTVWQLPVSDVCSARRAAKKRTPTEVRPSAVVRDRLLRFPRVSMRSKSSQARLDNRTTRLLADNKSLKSFFKFGDRADEVVESFFLLCTRLCWCSVCGKVWGASEFCDDFSSLRINFIKFWIQVS